MKPCPVEQVANLFNKDLTALGSFDKGLFKVGNANAQIFRDLFPENRPFEPISPAKEMDGEESDGDVGEEEDRGAAATSSDARPEDDLDKHNSEEEEDRQAKEATPVSDQWETADDPNPALPIKYNLRPRNKKTNYVFLIEEGPYVNITSDPLPDLEPILAREKRLHNRKLSFAKERKVAFLSEEDHLVYSPTTEHFVFVVEGAAKTWGRLPFDKTISKREVDSLYRAKLKRKASVKD